MWEQIIKKLEGLKKINLFLKKEGWWTIEMKYRILFKNGADLEILKRIKDKHNKDIEGIEKLYDCLIENASCESEIASRIYYVAYTLALGNIELILIRME